MKNYKVYSVLVFLFISISTFGQNVIVNSSNQVAKLSKSTLRNIYLGNTISWENSKQIIISDYVSDYELRNLFSLNYLDLSPKKVSMIWIKVSLSGKSIPPKVFHSEKEIIKFVSENEGAIGYVDKSANLPQSVKVIQIE